jgi:hypothetical protein
MRVILPEIEIGFMQVEKYNMFIDIRSDEKYILRGSNYG